MRKLIAKFVHFLGDIFVPTSMKKNMKSCEELGIELANKENPKTPWEKFDRWLHLVICYPCWTYSKQLELIDKKISSNKDLTHKCEHLSDKVAKEVIDQYSKKSGGDD